MGNLTSGAQQADAAIDFPSDGKGLGSHHNKSVEVSAELCRTLINKSLNDNVGGNISRKAFVRYFGSEKCTDFGNRLYEYVHRQNTDQTKAEYVTDNEFVTFVNDVRKLVTDSLQLKFYTTLFANDQLTIRRNEIEDLFRTCFLLESELVGSKYDCDPDSPMLPSVVEAMSLSCVLIEKSITLDHLQTWLRKNCPNMVQSSIHRWLLHHLGTVLPFPADDSQEHSAKLRSKPGMSSSSSISSMGSHHKDGNDLQLHPVLTWLFANTLPQLYTKPRQPKLPNPVQPTPGQFLYDPHLVLNTLMKFNMGLEWELLYNSSEHGQSVNRFQHHVFSYRGPTAMLVKTDGDVMLCIAIDQEWRERVSRWGGQQCMAIQITPCFKIFEVGEKLMYFNTSTRGYPFGLHVGQNPKSPTVEIDQDLCIAKVKKIPYKLELLEVWGCADSETKEAQQKQKKWETTQAEKHKKVNLNTVEWNENPDRYILELAGRPSYGKNFKT